MKRKVLIILVLLASMFVSSSMALTPGRVIMLVVPARYSVMQLAFDLAQKYAVVLVSYQGDVSSEAPLLHAWNGKEWIKIGAEDYANAAFLQMAPGEALLIGDEKLLPPVLASSIAGWCPKVTIIPSIDTAVLVNSFAREFSFKPSEWEWFTKRYNLALHDENEPRRNVSWYDRPAYEDKYTPKIDRWLGRRKAVPAPVEAPESTMTQPEIVPVEEGVVEVPVESESKPAGSDAVSVPAAADVNVQLPIASEAAFTDSPMPEEEARKALQAPLPAADNATAIQPAPAVPEESVAAPSPAPAPEIQIQPTNAEAPVK
jgi:hypothetical protein